MSRIVVLGGGESGTGSAILAKMKGFDVFLSDSGKIGEEYADMLRKWEVPFEEGGHTLKLILNADEIVKSPGIPSSETIIRVLVDAGKHIISEIEFAGRYDSAKKICVTGSNGKTTTTSLIHYLLRQAGINAGICGNIGKSYALTVATEHYDVHVLEISSFQLENMYDFKADIAVLTNITPDHLDRYDHSIEKYAQAKFRIIRNMDIDDCFIFCADDEITIRHLNNIVTRAQMLPFSQKKELSQGAFLRGDRMTWRVGEDEGDIFIRELALGGRHNVYNSMAAALAGKIMNVENDKIRDALSSFQPVEHRMEKVLVVGDVLYVNDSKATNVDAAWYALECQDKPVVWIAGGKDKGNDYTTLIPLVKEKVKALICLGTDNRKLHDYFKGVVPRIKDASSAEEAVRLASSFAVAGDVVLLSPCCSSFDLFENFEDRGRKFKEAVRNL